jgi:hypothetical protein
MAGRPKMVSIRKVSSLRAAPAAKTKRQSSIRRLAARFGSKAARREAAVYKPSETVVEEDDQEAEKRSLTATESSTGTRRSRRLQQQQRDQPPRPESKRNVSSRLSRGGSPSKLRKRDSKGSNPSPGRSLSKTDQAGAEGGPRESKPGAGPSLSPMMADWEIAPGRIHVGTGEDVESE